jgi:hypothetical protein
LTGKTGRLFTVLALALACAFLARIVAPRPVPQDPRYHQFAGEPTLGNVASNALFLAAGIAGLARLRTMRARLAKGDSIAPVATFCAGAILTGIGSTIYHLSPTDATLVYDRLGMVVAFAAFLTILLVQFGVLSGPGVAAGLCALLATGLASVGWWVAANDLRPYALFQAFPIVLFVTGSILFPRLYSHHSMLWVVTAGYVLAKLCEDRDREIYRALGGVVSGHTLKHLVAGAAIFVAIVWLSRRRPVRAS